jgi:hypothetical protein
MFKCWNCGTEHELPTSNDAYKRGWNAAYENMMKENEDEALRPWEQWLNDREFIVMPTIFAISVIVIASMSMLVR